MRISALCFLLLVSCATASPVVGPDGTEHLLLSCGSMEGCLKDARKECGGNFKIVHSNAITSGTEGDVSSKQELLVKCERAAKASP